MNIKRMAEAFKKRIPATGQDVKGEFSRVYSEGKLAACSISRLQYRLGSWKASLKRAGVEDLSFLQSSHLMVYLVNNDIRCGKKNPWDRKVRSKHISQIRIAEKEFDKFLKALPELLEQALTRAVHESGIRV